jgi:hypothetical protein
VSFQSWDYVLEEVRVGGGRHVLEDVSADGLAPRRQSTLRDRLLRALRGMRLVEGNPVQMGIRIQNAISGAPFFAAEIHNCAEGNACPAAE